MVKTIQGLKIEFSKEKEILKRTQTEIKILLLLLFQPNYKTQGKKL